MTKDKSSKYLQDVYGAKTNQELAESYDKWAEAYDEDVNSFGYVIPAVLAGLMGRNVHPLDGPILDAGAGTGLTGWIVSLLGYQDIVAIDLSTGMLEKAQKRGVFKALHQMVLGEHLDFTDNYFGAVVSTGVFTQGHAPSKAFDELARVVKPGGHILFSLHMDSYHNGGFKEKQEAMVKGNIWKPSEMTEEFPGLPLEDPNIKHRVFVYRVI